MKNFLYLLDPPEKDSLEERISKEGVVSKYWFHLAISMIILILTMMTFGLSIKMGDIKPAKTYEVDISSGKAKPKFIRTLPYPQESPKHRMAWVTEAVMKVYSFDFLNIDKRLRQAKYYFTPDSHEIFMKSIKNAKLIDKVKNDSLEISLVPLLDPILISRADKGESRVWHYRVPVLISYYGGVNVVAEKKNVEIKIIRSPLHKNPKGLEILSFVITGPSN